MYLNHVPASFPRYNYAINYSDDDQNLQQKVEINMICSQCKLHTAEASPLDETVVAKCVRVLLTVDEVALFLPDEKGIAQSREDEASQDLAGTGVSTEEAEAVSQ